MTDVLFMAIPAAAFIMGLLHAFERNWAAAWWCVVVIYVWAHAV